MGKISTVDRWHFVGLRPHLSGGRDATEAKTMYAMRSEYHESDANGTPIFNLQWATDARRDIEETGVKGSIGPREYEARRDVPAVYSLGTGFYTSRSGPQRDDL